MADCKGQCQSQSQGLEESEWRVASNLFYLRKQLSICSVRSVADSLFCRLQQAGVGAGRGARLAAQRRALAMAQQEFFFFIWGNIYFHKGTDYNKYYGHHQTLTASLNISGVTIRDKLWSWHNDDWEGFK